MMKRAWTTHLGEEFFSLSMESAGVADHQKLHFREITFPEEPNPENPQRHTVNLSLLTHDDINLLAQCLDLVRTDK